MPVPLTSEAILFAINSAIRLGGAIQRAYVNSLKAKQIVLPLPAFDATPTLLSASRFFEDENEGKAFLQELQQLNEIHQAKTVRSLTPDEVNSYLEYYVILFKALRNEETGPSNLNEASIRTSDILSLLRVRQWERASNPNPSVLQLVAGTLVEIGIDYFNQVPGALHPESTSGKVMESIMRGFDCIHFGEGESLKQTISKEVIPVLFLGAAETLAELSPKISGDPKVQRFIAQSAESISGDLIERLQDESNPSRREEATEWGKFVLNSLIRNAGVLIVNSPASVIRNEEKVYRVIEASGQAILDMLLSEDENEIHLRDLLSINSLDQIIRATHMLIAEAPELWSNKEGLQKIIKDLHKAVVESGIQQGTLLAHLLQMILETSTRHLHDLRQGDKEAHQFLVAATSQLLQVLAKKRGDQSWRPQLPQSEILLLVNHFLQHLISHPAFLMKKLEEDSIFYTALDLTLDTLSAIPQEERIRLKSLLEIFDNVIYAIIAHPQLLGKIKLQDDDSEAYIIKQFLDIILDKVSTNAPVEYHLRLALFQNLLDYTVEQILVIHPTKKGLILLKLLLHPENGLDFSEGLPETKLDLLLQAALKLLELHPEGIIPNEQLQSIFAGVANALKASDHQQAGLLFELIHLCILKVTEHSSNLLPPVAGLEVLLLDTLKESLRIISPKEEGSPKHPQFNGQQLLDLLNTLFEEVIRLPQLITEKISDDSILALVIKDILRALARVPQPYHISAEYLRKIIVVLLRRLDKHPKLLDLVKGGSVAEERSLLRHCLDIIIDMIFRKEKPLDLNQHLHGLLQFILDKLLAPYPDHRGLVILEFLASDLCPIDYRKEGSENEVSFIIDLLIKLMEQHPALLEEEFSLDKISDDLLSAVQALRAYPSLLFSVVGMVLEKSLGQLDWLMILEEEENKFKNLLTDIVEQICAVLNDEAYTKLGLGSFSGEQNEQIFAYILEEISEIPGWAEKERIKILLHGIFVAVQLQAKEVRIPFSTVFTSIRVYMEMARNHELWLRPLRLESEKEVMPVSYCLEWIFQMIFTQTHTTRIHLLKEDVFASMLAYCIDLNQRRGISITHMDDTALRLNEQINELAAGVQSIEDFITNLS